MALQLNKRCACLVLLLLSFLLPLAAQQEEKPGDKDYKDPDQFDSFYRRRKMISAWQINQLKNGALVVKLKTNKYLIEALEKSGNQALRDKKYLETAAINVNICRAFRARYTFSKLYFIFSNYGDSLLNGKRSGIFLDSNLVIDPNIVMKDSFYLISESDYLYNSSIGFLPEDSARFAVERGNPTVADVPIVLKNKYGHQLKRPFPYHAGSGPFLISTSETVEYVRINNETVLFNVSETMKPVGKVAYTHNGKALKLLIPKYYVMPWLLTAVENLNDALEEYYRGSLPPNLKRYPEIKPFLY